MKVLLLAIVCSALLLVVLGQDGNDRLIVTVSPARAHRRVGGSVEFHCAADLSELNNPSAAQVRSVGWRRPRFRALPRFRHVIFMGEGDEAQQGPAMANNTLLIFSLRFEDQGAYLCEVTLSTGLQETASASLLVDDVRGTEQPSVIDVTTANPDTIPPEQPPTPSPCLTNPCQHSGICMERRIAGAYTCICQPGWTADNCDQDTNECSNGLHDCPQRNSECVNIPGSYICQCDAGYELINGVCVDTNECESEAVECSTEVIGACINTPGSYICECPTGTTGDGRTCEPIECPELRAPPNGQVALSDGLNINSIADYTCDVGFDTRDLTIRVCFSHGSWTGVEPKCNDVDECESGTHECHINAECVDTIGSYQCICRLGYSGNGTYCTQIMCPMLDKPENGNVQVSGRSYRDQATFECFPGFRLNGLDVLVCLIEGSWSDEPPSCDDVDECSEGLHDCSPSADCVNTEGSYECICRDGYTGNGVVCTRIQCPELADPANGGVQVVPPDRYFMSRAFYTCMQGYSLDGVDIRVCAMQGQWTDKEPRCNDVDECALGNHGCHINANCINTNGSYMCVCLPGYYGDGRDCIKITCPQLQPLDNGRIRLSDGNNYQSVATHTCMIGYQLAGQRRRVCQNTSAWSGDNPTCVDVNECLDNPCSPNARCINEPGSFRCVCLDGYTGDGFVCRDIDECALGIHDCHRNAVCVNLPGTYNCECVAGYTGNGRVCVSNECDDLNNPLHGTVRIFGSGVGAIAIYFCNSGFNIAGGRIRYCEDGGQWTGQEPMCNDRDECSNVRCHPLATCRNTPGAYECICPPGYTGDGRRCVPIDPCANGIHGCDVNAECDASTGVAVCSCEEGFTGTGQACSDVDECSDAARLTNCDKAALCFNLIATYECVCPSGYTGNGTHCQPLDPCRDVVCGIHAVCVETTPPGADQRTAECRCEDGYYGDPAVMCVYVDPCDSLPCGVEGVVCAGSTHGYNCTCLPGYEQVSPTVCKDVNECIEAVDVCDQNALCTNLAGSYLCTCENGFIGNGEVCGDQDECFDSPCGENFECKNTVGSYVCDCPEGSFMDGQVCVRIVPGKCVKNGVELDIDETRDFPLTETRRASPPAADIIFVIDESASMVTEHQWLSRLSDQLDKALAVQGIGIAMPNYFGLVGFAKDSPAHKTGRIIRMENGRLFGSALDLSDATVELALDGRDEDMYYGIVTALEQYPFRPGLACQIVGVTDEGRTVLPPPVNSSLTASPTFNTILAMLQEKNCALNVVVNQQMSADSKSALGVGSSRDGFVEVGSGEFEVLRGVGVANVDSAHGSTHRAYTLLAFATGGGAWDLNKLRVGGPTADAFTKAFVWLKEREITRQLCERCVCIEGEPMPLCQKGCFGEPPFEIIVTGGEGGGGGPKAPEDVPDAVNPGGVAEFHCYAEGDPAPYFTWVLADGGDLPSAHDILGDQGNILRLRDVTRRTCVRCIAINSQGNSSAVQCINVAQSCPTEGGAEILHGTSERNYSTIRGDDIVNLPGSALVVFVVDESGSMVGEHQWLKTMAVTLEQNLVERDVRGNQYALVGFASPNPRPESALGRIVPVGRQGQHCGSAAQLRQSLEGLHIDGRREDGYSAMATALNQLSCMQERKTRSASELVVACQIILITDEDRDAETDWTYDRVLNDLAREDCILNVVVQGRFRGRDKIGRYFRALGLDRRGRAVVATPDLTDFAFLPNGEFVKDTGFGTTKPDYIVMANETGGGAWDLSMLRTEQYRESFTKGFIASKVEEIQLQIFGTCKECLCTNGSLVCQLLPGVSTRTRCISPPTSTSLRVQFGDGNAEVGEGDLLRLQCNATNTQGDKVTVVFRPHPIAAIQVGNDLFFRNISKADMGRYTCLARTAQGQTEAFLDLNVVDRAPVATPGPIRPGAGSSNSGADNGGVPAGTGGPDMPNSGNSDLVIPFSDVSIHASMANLVLGDALVLTCCVGPRAYPVLDWYFLDANGYELPLPATSVISDKGQLVIVSLAAEHSGRYQCVHRTLSGAEAGETTVRVRGQDVNISPTSSQCTVRN
eukprot:scpid7190/ scgid3720/ Fibrillin-1